MKAASKIRQVKQRLDAYWLARTEQERRFLSVGGAVVGLALLYSLFIGPALDGRAQLRKDLPQMRQDAAQLQALAAEARELGSQPAAQVVPISRETLTASLAARSLSTSAMSITGPSAKLEFKGVSFAGLMLWLDAQRHEGRIIVQDANFVPVAVPGNVDAALTLRQDSGDAAAGSK